ncbi:hypothetical protein BMS77_02055 [Leuconostoc pseudomesenteroides]|uniref:Tail spike domain-containing protein n=1 Tax=Leuconostoc pseudomesenteroides TaxID=33968 RepID=A0A1X0VEC3_LEUPS|nr:phage tail spike protein [Leuconostoc pseudomesenteroides]OQJ73324.1 hypothetical protein BMS77_02055 [Leuconostoc pseudomesenteroides]OQJ77526.1 hypothetical protein BMS83_01815 [Leuconostoc pseudomesenteroides]OQJ78181.1 hypothetical protein BMS82_03795 [Leuconostoc pseudomesenteroides]ORI37633.1 hypothetical protein BMR88_03770 [Leuconostoc pseudomesenteroides]ORI46020.1 hypothetical protein BMR94_04245 [Leuconostoc pseudomesenteroides]
MTPILYEKDEIDFTSQGLGSLVEIYDVDVEEQRNGLLQLTASYPVSGVRYADISVGRIILAKPNQRDDTHAFRIVSTELDISGYAVKIEADSITYDLTHNVVKHLVASGNGKAFMTALKNAIVNPSIFAFYSDIATSSTTSLNYVNPMEAIMGTTGSFLQIWGGELKRENRRVAMFNRRGRDNVATFRLGKNIAGLKYSVDISSLVTRIIPTKSVQNDNQTTTILEGAPVDSKYISNYEQIYTLPLEFTDDTIKTVADLNAAAKGWFTKSANTGRDKPTVAIDIDVLSLQDSADYQDKFKNLESVSLTDTVTVYVPEYGVNVTAVVNELHYDPILDRVTKMTVGTAKQSFADSSRAQLSDLQDKIISVQNQADAVAVSANGKSTNYYGSVKPSHPQKGDTWFWVNGDKSGIKVFVNGDWIEPVDSDTQEKIEASVTKAVAQVNAHTDEVKQVLSSDIATAKSQAASLANTAEANAKSEAVSAANSQAQNYVNQAKSDINDTINALSVGGRNYFIMNNAVSGYIGDDGKIYPSNGDMASDFIAISPDETWQLTIWRAPNMTGNVVYAYYDSNKAFITGSRLYRWWLPGEPPITTSINIPHGVAYMRVSSQHIGGNQGAKVKVEKGTIATDWTPAPEDVVLDYTTKDNKIKETITRYKETNDGHVSKLQTDVTTALGQIETKISQTDYDKKTGELSSKINEAKDTADKSLKTIGDYKTSNDKRVSDAESSIERTANAITEKVSKKDYDKKTGELTHDLSELKHTADGFEETVTKVKNLAVGGRNLLLGTATPWTVKANNNNFNFYSIYDHLKGGTTYTFSAEISVSNGQDSVSVGAFDASIGTSWALSGDFSKGVKRGSFTFTTPDHIDGDGHFIIYAGTLGKTAGLSATYTHMKLEEGNVPTAWTLAQEDIQSDIAQVKHTADSISNFVRDSSGNISSDFQTALSKTSIITDSTLATSIQNQTATQISSAITDNNGKIISLINQDSSGVQIAGKNIVLNGDTTVTGAFKVSQANIANGAIGTAQIGDAAITNAKIANLDVSKITGNVTNFIQSNWNGVYESTTITNDGMEIVTSDVTTNFGPYGIKLSQGGESVGGIGVSSYEGMPENFQGIRFNLDGTGDYMTWSARESGVTTGTYTPKLAWFRSSYKPIGQNAGFNFSSDSPVTFWGSIYGRDNTEPLKIDSFNMNGISAGGIGHGNGNSAITFGGDGEIYAISGGQYYKLARLVKALQPLIGLGLWSVPTNINSSGTVTKWTNVRT